MFGKGPAREGVTRLITAGDVDEDFVLRWAKKLNPPNVFEPFKASFECE